MEAISYNRPDWVDESSYPFRDNWMLIKGHQVHYLDEGPRDKPVLLFVHPGPGWSYTYRYQIEQLRKDFRCVAPDLPGYGLSKAANGYNFTLVEQAKVLEEFVETLDLRSIILWVNDGGGPTGILALGPHADRVVGLVVGGDLRLVHQGIQVRDTSASTSKRASFPPGQQIHQRRRLVCR